MRKSTDTSTTLRGRATTRTAAEQTPVYGGGTVPSSDVKVRGLADRGSAAACGSGRRPSTRASSISRSPTRASCPTPTSSPGGSTRSPAATACMRSAPARLFAAAADALRRRRVLGRRHADAAPRRPQRSARRAGAARRGTRPPRCGRATTRVAAAIDCAAFGAEWGNGAADLAEIRRATTSHRARIRRAASSPPARRALRRPPIVAFAISGAAGGQGYLQRLAVLPEHQRRGHGRALTDRLVGVDATPAARPRRREHRHRQRAGTCARTSRSGSVPSPTASS